MRHALSFLTLLAVLLVAGCDQADPAAEATQTDSAAQAAPAAQIPGLLVSGNPNDPCGPSDRLLFADDDKASAGTFEAKSSVVACFKEVFGVTYFRVDAAAAQGGSGPGEQKLQCTTTLTLLSLSQDPAGTSFPAEDQALSGALNTTIELPFAALIPTGLSTLPGVSGIEVVRGCSHVGSTPLAEVELKTEVSGVLPSTAALAAVSL